MAAAVEVQKLPHEAAVGRGGGDGLDEEQPQQPSAEDREDFAEFLEVLQSRGLGSPLWNWHERLHLCEQLPHLLHATASATTTTAATATAATAREFDDSDDPFGRMAVDFVGRVERIKEDVGAVLRTLGVGVDDASALMSALPHQNKQVRRHYRGYYSSERQRQIVHNIYKRDLEFFGYSF